jgi:hypothetical protein
VIVRSRNGDEVKHIRQAHPQCYKWCSAYALVNNGEGVFLHVICPKNVIGFKALSKDADIDTFRRVSYFKRAYANIKHHHNVDHCKGNTFLGCIGEKINNIGCNCTKLFTQTCPICIQCKVCKKPPAGIKPIVTHSFRTRGQVDLIDFQLMPNGEFQFLLNYLDHGVKFLFCIPLKRKHVSSIAVALLKIFTVIGLPMILQPDNGSKFSGAAMTQCQNNEYRGRSKGLNNCRLEEVIHEVKVLWPECSMVRRLPRHSPSNGEVERVNRTIEEKLGAWMAETQNTNWSIGCCLMMWRFDTQEHRMVGNVPYLLVFGQMPRVGISSLHLLAAVLDSLAMKSQLNQVCDYVGKVIIPDDDTVAVVDEEETHRNGKDEEEEGAKEVALNNNNHKNCNVVHEAEANSLIDAEVAAMVAFAEMVTKPTVNAATVGTIEVVNDNPNNVAHNNDDNDGKGEQVPVAEVVNEDKVVVTANGNPKVVEDNNKMPTWEAMVRDLPINIVFNVNFLWDLCLRVLVPIAWCKNMKEANCKESFVLAYITCISKHQYKLMDADDVGMIALEWDGNKGVRNPVKCTYVKFPMKNYLDYFRSIAPTAAISGALYLADKHKFSPTWDPSTNKHQAFWSPRQKKMKLASVEKMGGLGKVFVVGEVVQVPVADVDKAKVNNSNLTGVIVEVNLAKMKVSVVVKAGLLKPWYDYHKLSRVSGPEITSLC